MPIFERFQQHLTSSRLAPRSSPIVVAYSGGPDSTALLHMLHRAGNEVMAAHLHHGMRPEADQELRLCEAFCGELGVPFVSGRAQVPEIAKAFGIGIEEAGRRARYEFLERARIGLNASLIATGHTLDDHVETVLFHLTRGTGLAGLAGIPARRDYLIRPLLPFTRAETRAYCQAHHLWTHDDPANFDDTFSRVRIRSLIVPELERINPAFRENIARFADLAGEEDRFLDGMAAAALEQADIALNEPLPFLTRDVEVALQREALEALPRALARRALRLVAQALGAQPEADQIAAGIDILERRDLGAVTYPGGLVVAEYESDRIHVRRLDVPGAFRHPLTVPGETLADEFGWRFVATTGELPPAAGSVDAEFEPGAIGRNLHFRSWQEGDRIQPVGRTSEKKIGDLFTDARFTLAARRRLPMLCDMAGPIWVPGIALAERAAAKPESAPVLRVSFGPLEPAAP